MPHGIIFLEVSFIQVLWYSKYGLKLLTFLVWHYLWVFRVLQGSPLIYGLDKTIFLKIGFQEQLAYVYFCLVMSFYVWLCLVMSDNVCLCLVMSDYFKLCLVISGCFVDSPQCCPAPQNRPHHRSIWVYWSWHQSPHWHRGAAGGRS